MDLDEERLYIAVGRELRARRERLGLTQGQLAQRAGLLRTSVTNIEAGRQRAPLHVLYQLAHALDMEMTDALPRISELLHPRMVTVDIQGAPPEVPARTAEVLRRVWEEQDDDSAGS